MRRAGGGSRNQAALPDGGWVVRREGGADFHLSIWVPKLGAVRLAGRKRSLTYKNFHTAHTRTSINSLHSSQVSLNSICGRNFYVSSQMGFQIGRVQKSFQVLFDIPEQNVRKG